MNMYMCIRLDTQVIPSQMCKMNTTVKYKTRDEMRCVAMR